MLFKRRAYSAATAAPRPGPTPPAFRDAPAAHTTPTPYRALAGGRLRAECVIAVRINADWIGRRWFEMRIGYGTYLAFTFGFANFILLLHGLTDWFKDYPIHWFGIAMVAVIVPASVVIGHRHNRTQQKTESRNLTHLHPYINLLTPNSKEVLAEAHLHAQIDLMILTTDDAGLRAELERLRAALVRYMAGETATGALEKEGVRYTNRFGPGGDGPAVGSAPLAAAQPAPPTNSSPPDDALLPAPTAAALARRKAAVRHLVSQVDDHAMLRDISENCYARSDTSASWIGPFVPATGDRLFRSPNNILAAELAGWARAHWMVYDSLIDEFCTAEGDILDVGCGSGNTTLLLATMFPNNAVVGLDSDKKAIDFCKRHNATPGIEYLHTALEHYAGKKRKFRYVFACEVLEHMDHASQGRFIEACMSLLDVGGLLFVTTPNEPDGRPEGHHRGLLNRAAFKELHAKIGPSIVDFSYLDNSRLKTCARGADAVIRDGPGASGRPDGRNRSHFRMVLSPARPGTDQTRPAAP